MIFLSQHNHGCQPPFVLSDHVPVGREQEQTADLGHLEGCGGRQDADQLVSPLTKNITENKTSNLTLIFVCLFFFFFQGLVRLRGSDQRAKSDRPRRYLWRKTKDNIVLTFMILICYCFAQTSLGPTKFIRLQFSSKLDFFFLLDIARFKSIHGKDSNTFSIRCYLIFY